MSHYVHHIPGRLRIRSAAVKKNEAQAEAAKALLAGVPGVRSFEVNTLTGSIVVHYDPGLTSGSAITNILRDHGYFPHPALPKAPVTLCSSSKSARNELRGQFANQFAKKLATYAIETAIERSFVVLVGALL